LGFDALLAAALPGAFRPLAQVLDVLVVSHGRSPRAGVE
jgi:hypothetical protein